MLSVYSCTAACPVRHSVYALHAAWGVGRARRIWGIQMEALSRHAALRHGAVHAWVVAGSFVSRTRTNVTL